MVQKSAISRFLGPRKIGSVIEGQVNGLKKKRGRLDLANPLISPMGQDRIELLNG